MITLTPALLSEGNEQNVVKVCASWIYCNLQIRMLQATENIHPKFNKNYLKFSLPSVSILEVTDEQLNCRV